MASQELHQTQALLQSSQNFWTESISLNVFFYAIVPHYLHFCWVFDVYICVDFEYCPVFPFQLCVYLFYIIIACFMMFDVIEFKECGI